MKVLAIGRLPEGVQRADLAPYQQAELRQAWQLYSEGVIREMYTRADAPAVVVMMEVRDLEHARAAVDSLPMVEAGVLAFDLMSLGPFLHFQALFAPVAETEALGRSGG